MGTVSDLYSAYLSYSYFEGKGAFKMFIIWHYQCLNPLLVRVVAGECWEHIGECPIQNIVNILTQSGTSDYTRNNLT